ncbi:MAG: Crp/Fnr family transcriptional regulator [Firmicutes bacterium]|nr:Crp/Fnr family transcriptional regulator [Bacillota bacterium]
MQIPSPRERLQGVRDLPLFAGLPEGLLVLLNGMAVSVSIPAGTEVFREGDENDQVYVVQKGLVKVIKVSETGKEQILQVARPGDVFPLGYVFHPGPLAVSARAVEPSLAVRFGQAELLRLLQADPDFCLRFVRLLSRRLREAQVQLRDMALRGVHGRLAALLLKLAQQTGEPGPEGVSVEMTLTHQDLANLIGSSRETVTRVLAEFRKEGAVDLAGSRLVLLDQARLRDWP